MVPPTLATSDFKTLVAYGEHEVLEGESIEGIVIVEFPTRERARAWYDSPAYQAAREHRFRGAKYRCILVQGTKRSSSAPRPLPCSIVGFLSRPPIRFWFFAGLP